MSTVLGAVSAVAGLGLLFERRELGPRLLGVVVVGDVRSVLEKLFARRLLRNAAGVERSSAADDDEGCSSVGGFVFGGRTRRLLAYDASDTTG